MSSVGDRRNNIVKRPKAKKEFLVQGTLRSAPGWSLQEKEGKCNKRDLKGIA